MATVANSVICGVFLSNNSYWMQMYTNKADEKKNIAFFSWLCGYAESRRSFDEIEHRHHSMRLAMSQKVSRIGKSKTDKE